MKVREWLCVTCCIAFSLPTMGEAPAAIAERSVVRIIAKNIDSTMSFGSGVAIDIEAIATTCHTIRRARALTVEVGGRQAHATLVAADADKDVCVLSVPGLRFTPVAIRPIDSISAGASVVAASFPAGRELTFREGRIEALHAHQSSSIIQTSTTFDRGASGGALLTTDGELVGLLTFKAPEGERFHFAIPAEWIEAVRNTRSASVLLEDDCAFWEKEPADQPRFLHAAWHESKGDWLEVYRHCLEWISADPASEEAHRALKRAIGILAPY